MNQLVLCPWQCHVNSILVSHHGCTMHNLNIFNAEKVWQLNGTLLRLLILVRLGLK